jgi:predicted lipoprotein with Yx(FWY)xxD motif
MASRVMRWALLLALAAAAGAGAVMATAGSTSSNRDTVGVRATPTFGTVLVAGNGRTLYRYTVDSKRVNRCSAVPACGTNWPALLVKAGTKPTVGRGASAALVGTIPAAHGMRQVTYAGFPLYFFKGDRKSGQANGQGFGSKWYVVGTTGALVRSTVQTATTTPAATTSSSDDGGYGY